MTVEHYGPEDYGIGYDEGPPIAPSVDSYSDYPDDWQEAREYRYRDIVAEVLHETYWLPWARLEMDIGPHPKTLGDNLVIAQQVETSNDTKYHVELQGFQQDDHTVYHSPKTYHVAQIGSPLENEDFLEKAVERGYEPADIAALFKPLGAGETKERLEYLGLLEDSTLEIGSETVDLDNYHDEPHRDARLLEKFDSANYGLGEVAEALSVPVKEVTKQARAYGLTAE